MDVQLVMTGDGSHTLFVPDLKEHYHSTFGAIQESMHVFINAGLLSLEDHKSLNILEIGFGTGLNALITLAICKNKKIKVNYDAVEPFPLDKKITQQLNYCGFELVQPFLNEFRLLHRAPYDTVFPVTPNFFLKKIMEGIELFDLPDKHYQIVYFDAFAPDVQPELWRENIFRKIYLSMKDEGILTTYSAKGSVRRAMKVAGFSVEKLAGPPGKREITRAKKI
ncbi:MAG: tRNA (5-methylaminomethyl-2-thiouridine)(34)-methyltransferase MnmD [Bacteroidetes bacterium]|nr:tRNA (5-methylaminomethyl-2-thiouridine)(34)-methyltransferase MnmD [Bacteroidota bacterium]